MTEEVDQDRKGHDRGGVGHERNAAKGATDYSGVTVVNELKEDIGTRGGVEFNVKPDERFADLIEKEHADEDRPHSHQLCFSGCHCA